MKFLRAILPLLAILIVGCDTLHSKQYRIAGITANSSDAIKLKAVLDNVANKIGLVDYSSASHVTNSFGFYAQEYPHHLPNINAWYYKDGVWIEVIIGYGTTPEYKEANRLLQEKLKQTFGSRFSISSHSFR